MAKSEKTAEHKPDARFYLSAAGFLSLFTILLWLFFTLWFSGGRFASAFGRSQVLSTVALGGVLVFLMGALYGFSFYYTDKDKLKTLFLVGAIIFLCAILCTVCESKIKVYAMPIALCAVLLSLLVNIRVAMGANVILSQMLLIVFLTRTPLTPVQMAHLTASVFCNSMCGFMMIYLLSQNYTRIKFVLMGITAGFVMAPFAALVTLAAGAKGMDILMNALWVLVANFISILLSMPLLPVLEAAFNLVTDFKLDELCNFSQPLLKRLAAEASGTFNHSMIVGNLAERCAVAVGENPHLARAAGYYHDVGKLRTPDFFVENQRNGVNPHDELIPEVSVSMIIKHTAAGAALIREYRLPDELATVAEEHHGTSPVGYFYYKAQLITEGDLDPEKYRYEGPKPHSKISGIIMICDICESAVRAVNPETRERLEELVDRLTKEKLDSGQFDECDLTLEDIAVAKRTIVDSLPGVYHARIKYRK